MVKQRDDSELVVKKKVGGRQGKKKWMKQSDTTNLQHLQLKELKQSFDVKSSNKHKSKEPAFKIQIEPDASVKKRLDKDRFKSADYEDLSKTEIKKVKKIEKSNLEEAKKLPQTPRMMDFYNSSEADIEATFDLWTVDKKELKIHHDKPILQLGKDIEVPKVLKPYGGQSYNPSFNDQLELMDTLVDKAEIKKRLFKSKSDKAKERTILESLKKRPPVFSSKKEKSIWLEQQKAKEQKRKLKELENIEEIINRQKNLDRKHGKLSIICR